MTIVCPGLGEKSVALFGPPAESDRRYRRLFETAPDGILILDPETRRIIDVNPSLLAFLGYEFGEVVGKELFEIGLLADEAASQRAFMELQGAGYIRYDNLPLQTKKGLRMEVECISTLYFDGNQPLIQCTFRDIAARRLSEQALSGASESQARRNVELEVLVKQRTAELQLSNAQLETFTNTIAHDLRAPLRTMQGFSQLLVQMHAGNLGPTGCDYANYIDDAAQKMDRLLTDLLAFSHLSQQEMELAPVSLENVVESALEACESERFAKAVTIDCARTWPHVYAHAATLRQVMFNLINNAVKFVADTAPHVTLRAERREGGIVRVWVEDNGIGIPPEFQDRIFRVFQRLHTAAAYPGTGIGLSIVQKGMERMRGRVGLESTPRAGSKFWIELTEAPAMGSAPGFLPRT